MKLINQKTGEEFEAEIVELTDEDFVAIKKSREFDFDWDEEKENNVFKLVSTFENSSKIYGLISIIDIGEEMRIHINLVENANENKGGNKKINRVAGCLIAFAVRIAFEKGYLGFTSLVPKTRLINHYIEKYGFSQFGRQLAIERQEAINLIQKYL